jgi:hypothetical protein
MIPAGIFAAMSAIEAIVEGAPKLMKAAETAGKIFDIVAAVVTPVSGYMALIKKAREEGRDITDAELQDARTKSQVAADKFVNG